jgi:hypothetical protein
MTEPTEGGQWTDGNDNWNDNSKRWDNGEERWVDGDLESGADDALDEPAPLPSDSSEERP